MINLDPKVQRIMDWRESFVTLPDNHFFELIRMYLGEIHSPFNKQKLMEQLGAFLRKEENRTTIVNLLSESDLLILTAVWFIPDATNEKLSDFFSSSIHFAKLYERLLNLEERLLIYRHIDKNTKKTIISINPTLEDVLEPLLSKKTLLPQPVLDKRIEGRRPVLTPERIGGFLNFVMLNPALCKADGTIKKRDGERLELIFGSGSLLFCQLLMTAFINLSLVKEFSGGWKLDLRRLEAFAELPDKIQYAYICAASVCRLSITGLVKQAKLLLETTGSIPATGFTETGILRSAFLIYEGSSAGNGVNRSAAGGRFASILAKASASTGNSVDLAVSPAALMERLMNSAVVLGFLSEYGVDEKGKAIYVKGGLFDEQDRIRDGSLPKVLNVDAGFNVMIFPGLALKHLLPLMSFLEIKQFDTAAVFELNKKVVMKAFDNGTESEKIYSLISTYCAYQLPENLRVSIEDWSSSYSSASLYKGYVLKVDEKNAAVIQNNPAIAPSIYQVLAPGVFLLRVKTDEEAEAVIAKSGLDYIGQIKSAESEIESACFPGFDYNKSTTSVLFGAKTVPPAGSVSGSLDDESETPALPSTEEERKNHFDTLRGLLDKMAITPEQREGLLLRINRKIILTSQQLIADSVKQEQIEATGMDYQGKIHVAESAITQNMMLELEFDDKEAPNGLAVIIGTPVSVEKNSQDAAVHMIVEPDHEERTFSIGRARNVKRIRGNLFR